MKTILSLFIIFSLFIVACSSPPSDVPSAVVQEPGVIPTDEPVEDTMQEEVLPVEPDGGIGDGAQGPDSIPQASSVPIDVQASSFIFEGFAPGRSHEGTFDEWSGNFVYENGQIIGGSGTVQASSVNTGISALDNHLQTDDFFDVEKYPEITAEFIEVTPYDIVLDITFRGVTKRVSVPAVVSTTSMQAEFLLDIEEFDMKYLGINEQVRIQFEFFT